MIDPILSDTKDAVLPIGYRYSAKMQQNKVSPPPACLIVLPNSRAWRALRRIHAVMWGWARRSFSTADCAQAERFDFCIERSESNPTSGLRCSIVRSSGGGKVWSGPTPLDAYKTALKDLVRAYRADCAARVLTIVGKRIASAHDRSPHCILSAHRAPVSVAGEGGCSSSGF